MKRFNPDHLLPFAILSSALWLTGEASDAARAEERHSAKLAAKPAVTKTQKAQSTPKSAQHFSILGKKIFLGMDRAQAQAMLPSAEWDEDSDSLLRAEFKEGDGPSAQTLAQVEVRLRAGKVSGLELFVLSDPTRSTPRSKAIQSDLERIIETLGPGKTTENEEGTERKQVWSKPGLSAEFTSVASPDTGTAEKTLKVTSKK